MPDQGGGIDARDEIERIENLLRTAREIIAVEEVRDCPLDRGRTDLKPHAIDDRNAVGQVAIFLSEATRRFHEPAGEIGGLDDARPTGRDAAMAWAVGHLSEREAVFARTDLLAAALAWKPGSVTIGEAEAAAARLEKEGTLHACGLPQWGESLTTDKAVADEKETIALMERGRDASRPVMRSWIAGPLLHNGRLTVGQKEAVKTTLSSRDRVVGVQGYAGTGKTTMLDRARQLAAKSGYRMIGVAPSASAARTLAAEAGIETETLQRFLARNAGIADNPEAEGRKAMVDDRQRPLAVLRLGEFAAYRPFVDVCVDAHGVVSFPFPRSRRVPRERRRRFGEGDAAGAGSPRREAKTA